MRLCALRVLVLVAVLAVMPGCVVENSPGNLAISTRSPQGDGEHSTSTTLGIGSQQEAGVVVTVDGTLARIDSFSVLLGDGSTILLSPRPGLLFDGGPLAHLRDHLVSGSPVTVVFHQEGDKLVATQVGDAE